MFFTLYREVFPLTMDFIDAQHNFLLHAEWTPRGNALILVYNYDIYYKPSPTSSRVLRLTDSAVPGIISNGLPDWLYEGKAYRFMFSGRNPVRK